MEHEQFFYFITYHILNYEEKTIEGKRYLIQHLDVMRASKTRGIYTDFDKYRRVKVDFDPLGYTYVYAICLLTKGVEKNRNIVNIFRCPAVFVDENDAKKYLKNKDHLKTLGPKEELLKADVVYLPVIDK